ncbi:MAG TPA: septum formation family protein [Actinotalea sp.]
MSATPPPGPPGPSGAADGYYPQEPYYAPGWQTPAEQVRRRGPRRGIAISLIVIGALVVATAAVGVGALVRMRFETRALGTVDSPVTVSSRRLSTGHCIGALPRDGDVNRVGVVPCDQPHEAEVVGVLALDGDWPGQARLERKAEDYCEMDRAESGAGFQPVVWTPSRGSWGQGDRKILCLAWRATGPVTGSFSAGDDVSPAGSTS